MNINFNNKQNTGLHFGSNLIVGQGVIQNLQTNPQDIKDIQEFKDFLAKDGKNFNVELTHDSFEPKSEKIAQELSEYNQTYNWALRKASQQQIAEMKDANKAAETIKKILQSDISEWVKRDAAELCGFISNPDVAAEMIESLIDDSQLGPSAASSAGHIKDSKKAGILIDKLLQHKNPEVRERTAYAIEDIQDETIKKDLIKKYSDSPNKQVKGEMASAAAKIDDNEFFAETIEKLSQDNAEEVQKRILYAIADADEEKLKTKSQLFDSIILNGVKNKNPNIRESAASTLGKLSNTDQAVSFIKELMQDESKYTRWHAIRSINDLKDETAQNALIKDILKSDDIDCKEQLLYAFQFSDNTNLKNHIESQLIQDKDPSTRQLAFGFVSCLNDSKEIEKVVNSVVSGNDSKSKEAIMSNLKDIKDKKLRNKLIEQNIQSKDYNVKKGLLSTLEDLSDEDCTLAKKYTQILAKDENKIINSQAKRLLENTKVTREETSHYSIKVTDANKDSGKSPAFNPPYGTFSLKERLQKTFETIVEQLS